MKEEAFRRHQSFSETIRMFLEKGLEASDTPKKVGKEKTFAFVGMIQGERPDVAKNHDAYLAEAYLRKRKR